MSSVEAFVAGTGIKATDEVVHGATKRYQWLSRRALRGKRQAEAVKKGKK